MTSRTHQGMTLIELLIAIGVFSVGVLAVLQLVTNNIRTTDHVSKHMDATMLATQGLELMYEMRNTNSYKEARWDCYEVDLSEANKTSQDPLDKDGCKDGEDLVTVAQNSQALAIAPVGPDGTTYWTVETKTLGENPRNDFRLYRHVSDGNKHLTSFTHEARGGTATPYARYITVEAIEGYQPEVALKVTSHVLVDQGGDEPKEVSISSIIGNIID